MSFEKNRICDLLGIKLPIIQAGMVWCSGWELASASSNAGCLGVLGAGSMYPDVLEQHILKCKERTNKPFAVNLPLLYPQIDDHISIIKKHKVPVVITSAGNPKKYTSELKSEGIIVIHVVSSRTFAQKAEKAGVDAIIAEGFEAGGHNGREETTTLCLIPSVSKSVTVPLIAAGGIYSGKSMLATMLLGAEGVQIGSRFVTSLESSAHIDFKNQIIEAQEGHTKLSLKKIAPVRLLKNQFYEKVNKAEMSGCTLEELQLLLGKGRAKAGMFLGDMENGELEIGQCSAMIGEIKSVNDIVNEIIEEFEYSKSLTVNL